MGKIIDEYCFQHRQRICTIIKEIDNGSYPSLTRLSKLCGVSSKTIQRDLGILRNHLNAPLEYDITKKGWFKTEASYSLYDAFERIRNQFMKVITENQPIKEICLPRLSLGGTTMLKAGLVIWEEDGKGNIHHLVEKELHQIDGWNGKQTAKDTNEDINDYPMPLGTRKPKIEKSHLDIPLTKKRKRRHPLNISNEQLQELLNRFSIRNIAQQLNCHPTAIYKRMKKYAISKSSKPQGKSKAAKTSPEIRAKMIEARIAGKGPTQIAKELLNNKLPPAYVSNVLSMASKTNPELRKALGRDNK